MKRSSGFGQPKPLPGQVGYGEKVVDVLEKETSDMEARLQTLQERLRAQQMMETDSKPSSGGSKWKSSKTDKGSIRSYGKEISDKAKKKTLEISQGVALMSKSTTLPTRSNLSSENTLAASHQNPTISFSSENSSSLSKDVADWDLSDVSEWLSNLGVPQYADSFASNEMIGSMLLDITLEDLDYMNVKVLAHRKLILRAIEDLRQQSSYNQGNKAPSALLRTSSRGSARPIAATEKSDLVQVGAETASAKSLPAKVHWSHLDPITSKELAGGSRTLPVNAADDTIDEEAERLAFQQAVEEWRRGSSSTTQKGKFVTVREIQKSDLSSVSASAEFSDRNGEWVNPFALPAAPPQQSSLNNGVLDEEAEHAEFVKAVEEWRNAKKSGNTNQSSAETIPVQTPRSISVGGTAISNAKQLADELALNLEKEKEAVFKGIQKRREDAEKKLQEAAKELEAIREAKAKNARPPTVPDMKESSADEMYRSDSKPIIDRPVSSSNAKDIDPDVYVPKDIEFDDEDDDDDAHLTTSVRIEVVESITGAVATSDEGGCVIEYASDTD